MGTLSDLTYYAPYLTPGRALNLVLAKFRKRAAKNRVRAAMAGREPEDRLFSRLGLPVDRDRRLSELRRTLIPLVQTEPPGKTNSWAAIAEAVTGGTQTLFGQEQTVGWPPGWNWRWTEPGIAALMTNDVRTIWEIQRLQGILPLALAAAEGAAEDRERFAAAYVSAVLDFHRQNPGPSGIAWESALELGLRLIALAQGLPLIVDTQAFAEHHEELISLVDRHARWLAADLSLDKVIRGNHLLGELAGLLVAGHLLPSARPAWWGSIPVASELESEILAQIHPDGVSVEQSLTYEKFVLEFLAEAARISAVRQRPFPPAVLERMRAGAEHLDAVTAPDGELPRVGDCDSGLGIGGERAPHEPAGLVDRIRKLIPGNPTSPAVFTRDEDLETAVFPVGGHVSLKTGRGDYLFTRGGPFGHGSSAHSHADLLSPVLYLRGEAILIDPGVLGYGVPADVRDAYRIWPAHNVLYLEPGHGPRPAGAFRWAEIGSPARLELTRQEGAVVLDGEVSWGRGAQALLWHRSISYNQLSDFWLICDRTSNQIQGPVFWAFHFAPGVLLEERERGRFLVTTPSGRKYQAILDPAGEVTLRTAPVAPAYGMRSEGLVLGRRVDTPPEKSELRISPA